MDQEDEDDINDPGSEMNQTSIQEEDKSSNSIPQSTIENSK